MEAVMKKYRIGKVCMTVCMAVGIFMIPAGSMQARADEVMATVQGDVMDGTTTELLILNTKDGKMEIKIDSGTDTGSCKVLLPGNPVNVAVSHGSDGYLHAARISTGAVEPAVTMDTSMSMSVIGTIGDKSTGDLLYFNTDQGEMQIKLDTTTDLSGCKVLVAKQRYRINCTRGSDGYLHATVISDADAGTAPGGGVSPATGSFAAPTQPTVQTLTPAPSVAISAETTSVTGTVGSNTKEDRLCLMTSNGEMQIQIDDSTDSRSGMVLVPDLKVTVSVYRSSDAYMHAATIVGAKDNVVPATVDSAAASTVSGTVGSKSNENILYLTTDAGDMEIKLDTVRSVTGCKVLTSGRKITVSCSRGVDAFMHALDITAN